MPATLSELEQQNPNLRGQIEEWQNERTRNGQNPTDWEAFRQHAMAIGAPDPGQEAPREFMQSAVVNAASGIMSQVTEQREEPRQEPPQAPQQQAQGQPQEKEGEDRGGGFLGRLFGGR